MIERWVFTQSEIDKADFKPKSDDEFIATVPGQELDVIVYRNGTVSNRWADGTIGVPAQIVELADAEETLHSLDLAEFADVWRDVVVDDEGNFKTPA
jgi:hypothetical protein